MQRYKNIDILRAVAILIIIGYHCYALGGYPWAEHTRIHAILSFGGTVGVTMFFCLSGFGLYCSLAGKEKMGTRVTWGSFMKGRCARIMPAYYVCIGILLIFQSFGLWSKNGLRHILSYVFFVQNLMPETHGSINGALWAMATIFQFYLIALFLYRMMRKKPYLTVIGSMVVSIACKVLVYHVMIPALQLEGTAYFVYGTQMFCVLDNFVLGLFAAHISTQHDRSRKKKWQGCIGVMVSGIGLLLVSYVLSTRGVYTDAVRGYIGLTILAVLFTVMMISAAVLPQLECRAVQIFHMIAKHQYAMYLWHMPVIAILLNGAPVIQELAQLNFAACAIVLMIIAVFVGYVMSVCVDSGFLRRFCSGFHLKKPDRI